MSYGAGRHARFAPFSCQILYHKVLNGRFGPYITDGTKNAKIPKDTDPKDITHEEAKKLLSEAKPGKKRPARRTTKKK